MIIIGPKYKYKQFVTEKWVHLYSFCSESKIIELGNVCRFIILINIMFLPIMCILNQKLAIQLQVSKKYLSHSVNFFLSYP